jgi:hypothetical protein
MQMIPAVNIDGKNIPMCDFKLRPHNFQEAMAEPPIFLCTQCGTILVDSLPTAPRIRIESDGTREGTHVWLDGVDQDMKAIMFHASALEPEATWKIELV